MGGDAAANPSFDEPVNSLQFIPKEDSHTMTPQAKRALEYVRNAGGNATYDNFMDDHEPIGVKLWHELRSPVPLIRHDPTPGRAAYLVLTDEGIAALSNDGSQP